MGRNSLREEIVQEIFDVVFSLSHQMPNWYDVPDNTKDFIYRRADRIIKKVLDKPPEKV